MKNLILLAAMLSGAGIGSPWSMWQDINVKNPTTITFEPSPDHAMVESYELDLLRADGTVLQTLNVGKPSVVNGVASATINVQPVTFGVNYSARIRARAGSATSDYADSVNKFDRAPGSPSNPRLK